MSTKNIAAFTAAGSEPPYLSINDKGNNVSVSLRGFNPSALDGRSAAELHMTHEKLQELARIILTYYEAKK